MVSQGCDERCGICFDIYFQDLQSYFAKQKFDCRKKSMEVSVPSVHQLYVPVEAVTLQLCFLRPKPKERRKRDRSFLLIPPPTLDPCKLHPLQFIGPPPFYFEDLKPVDDILSQKHKSWRCCLDIVQYIGISR
jgi:hypothetical protein